MFSDTKLFAESTQDFGSVIPVPTALADTQVLINGQPSPLFYVSPGQINFVAPMNVPTNATVEIQVVKPSQGQIRAVSMVATADASPALFTADGSGVGQLVAANEDNTVNSVSNPVQRGHVIVLYGTGQGFVPNAPPDGVPPSGPVQTSSNPVVYVNGVQIDGSNVLYSGLAGFVGGWQINVKIPDTVPPGLQTSLLIQYKSIFTSGTGQRTTIAVKQ
jgi:uncharacterized protein (TIGR03437 family)